MSGAKQINNPTGAFGYTDLRSKLFALEGDFQASAAVTARRVVAIGTDGKVALAATDGTASLAIGIAQDAIASGNVGSVVLMGIAEDVPATGTIAAGDILKRSVTTTGSVSATTSAADGEVIGVAINASASNVVDVWVFPSKVGLTA